MGDLVIGRESADLVIEDAQASRRHAVVRLLSGSLEIEDLGSSNGTFVNGSRITEPTRIGDGARIRIGTTELEVEGVRPVGQTAADSPMIADPQATRARPIVDPDATRARPIVDPEVTRARPIVDPDATRARPIVDPEVTRARPIVSPQATPAGPASATSAHGLATPAHAPPAHLSAAPTPVPAGGFVPPSSRRSRGLASRSWVPVVLSFGTVALVAIALVIYFASQ